MSHVPGSLRPAARTRARWRALLGGVALLAATQLAAAPALGAPVPAATPAPVLTPQLAVALTARLKALRVASAIPGITATIIFPDGRSWRAHSGFLDLGQRIVLQNSTPFPVASVTKTFIAALVLQLSGEGRFGLDDPVSRYLPAAGLDARVTIRELLAHTSGVADYFANSRIDTALLACPACAWTPAMALSYVKKPLFVPGTEWSYSNTNYLLLGELVEAVMGQDFASLLRQRFFDPLHLVSTYVQGHEPPRFPVAHSYRFTTFSLREQPTALWDGTGISPFRSVVTAANSAGDIASSARDLAVWARALYGGAVLSPPLLQVMLDVSRTAAFHPTVPYGLGMEQYTVAGTVAYGHNGRLLGAKAAIRYLPEVGLAIGVVMNTDRGNAAEIAAALAEVIVPPPVGPTPSPAPSPSPSPSAGASAVLGVGG
jgi:D-alanyl-D-alanine carboxypeptidase